MIYIYIVTLSPKLPHMHIHTHLHAQYAHEPKYTQIDTNATHACMLCVCDIQTLIISSSSKKLHISEGMLLKTHTNTHTQMHTQAQTIYTLLKRQPSDGKHARTQGTSIRQTSHIHKLKEPYTDIKCA